MLPVMSSVVLRMLSHVKFSVNLASYFCLHDTKQCFKD